MSKKYGEEIRAYCYANGVIKFRSAKLAMPDGALPIMIGPGKIVRDHIKGAARLGYDNKTLLVPGVPEAPNQLEGVEALKKWKDWVIPKVEEAIDMAEMDTPQPQTGETQ